MTSTVLSTLVSAIALQALPQETGEYDATCYLRIEGRNTQDLSRFCGKKTPKPVTAATPGKPAVRSAPSPSAAIDPDDAPDEDQPVTTVTPRIPSTRFPSPPPVAQPSPVRPPVSQRSTLPTVPLVPNQTPDSEDVLPVPTPPVKRQPPAAERKRMASKLKPSPQATPLSLPPPLPEDDVQASMPRSPFKQRRFVPTVPTALAPPVGEAKPQTQVASKPQPSPLDTLLQELLHQKYLYLFWVLVLQVPLLKVAIDRRSRPSARSRIQPIDRRIAPRPRVPSPADGTLPDRVLESPPEEAILSEARALETETQAASFDLAHADNQIAQIKAILANAVRNRVSDIHLEPSTEGLRVRYRIDGILRNVTTLPFDVSRRTIVALKVMADMDISESRRPQDARISEQYTSESAANLDLDLRVSTLPCVGGEKAVIRLLPRQNPFTHMDALGFTEKALSLYKSWLQQPQGMIIFTGPTGSGKTSTLYTSLQTIATEHVNVVTVEDPVEYILPSITQTQVNEAAGMTFAAGLRAILRQDPDIIMVGEIRDGETAETAVRAALTGHLVLTTLHTNDAVGAIPRLRDVGPDPGLISDALLGVVAQRLVRRVCSHCAEPYTPTESDLSILGLSLAEAKPHAWRHGRGCSHCYQSGYVGREAIIELLHVDATIRQLIYEGSLSALMAHLNQSEFDSFRKAAIAKVTSGVTTIAEIRRVLPASKLANDV
ncbi:MAG: ATPase, T2SS/T4P/T4SS family [Leptolyngbya sp. BL-A-14]